MIQAVWRKDNFNRSRKDINHLVWRIREKLELDSRQPQFLKTVKGKGYRLEIKILE